MKHVRVATPEEIEAIKDKADLMPGHTQILALDNEKGGADIAVVRNCFELNPVIYAEDTNDMRRARFLYALEERFLGAGVDRYYFQLDATKEHYIKVAKAWGAEQVSLQPELRMLKVIK
jgi:hypothetical protein